MCRSRATLPIHNFPPTIFSAQPKPKADSLCLTPRSSIFVKKTAGWQAVTLKDGTRIDARIVVNVAGPHSYIINRMAGVEEGMNIKTSALRQEVCHVPAPEGIDYQQVGTIISDGDIGCYSRPETGNHILVGSEDPECDEREYVDPDNYDTSFTKQWTAQAMREAQRIEGLTCTESNAGRGRPIRRI